MKLLIPGPVTTSPEVKAAMAQDFAPWDNDFRAVYADIRARVLRIAGGQPDTHTAMALQGCGHFAAEAAVRTFLPPGGKILVPLVGAYADRMARLATEAGRQVVTLKVDQHRPLQGQIVADALAADPSLSHVGLVYSETGSGVIHDPVPISTVVHAAGRRLIIDAVSAFGAMPMDVSQHPALDVVIFTSNKCFEAMPGLSFAVARIDRLEASKGNAGSWSFDYADVYANLLRPNSAGVFRFTPPAQVLASFGVALDIFERDGGQPARLARYQANKAVLYDGMIALGLEPYLPRALQGPIIVNIHAPDDPAWDLMGFVDRLKRQGWLISNFYNTAEPSFRVGCIGAITPEDMRAFVQAVDAVLTEMGIRNRSARRLAA
jgi:2-aminoethylphosphonate-pyruvate transaminase